MRKKKFKRFAPLHSGVPYNCLDLIQLFICMLVSDNLIANPVFGAAIYISMLFWVCFGRLWHARQHGWAGRRYGVMALILCAVALVIDGLLILYYPSVTGNARSLWVLALSLGLHLRTLLTDELARRIEGHARACALAAMHAGFILLSYAALMLWPGNSEGRTVALFAIAITGVGLFGIQLFTRCEITAPTMPTEEIHSYKIYSNMAFYSYLAFYLSIMTFSSYILYLPNFKLAQDFLSVLAFILLELTITFMAYRVISRNRLRTAEKSMVFISGAICWGAAARMLYQNLWSNGWMLMLCASVLWAVGLACMNAVLTCLREDLRLVTHLLDDCPAESAIRWQSEVVRCTALMIAGLIELLLLTVFSFLSKDGLFAMQISDQVKNYFKLFMTVLPGVFILISLVFALVQPLNRQYMDKLEKYVDQEAHAQVNPTLKERLRFILVKKYRRRFGIKIIMAVLRPFFRHKVVGKEHVADLQTPAVLVCNHGEIYGPVVMVLYLPVYFRPWIISQMLTKEQLIPHVFHGTFEPVNWLPPKLGMLITRMLAPLLVWLLGSVDPIPVYRNNLREVKKTLDLSVQAMEYDDNILIFPENPAADGEERYAKTGVTSFFTGFVRIAEDYYKRTGKATTFFPIYADKKTRTIHIEKGILYNPQAPRREEKNRIVHYLENSINAIAAGSAGRDE